MLRQVRAKLDRHRQEVEFKSEAEDGSDMWNTVDELQTRPQPGEANANLPQKTKTGLMVKVRRFLEDRPATVALLFCLGFMVSISFEFGMVFCVLFGFFLIFIFLGERKEGEPSAYPVFNNYKDLMGQVRPHHFERDLFNRRHH